MTDRTPKSVLLMYILHLKRYVDTYVHFDSLEFFPSATGISVSVIYLDRGDNKEASAHQFPDDKEPMLHLLYRPGHYDVLYAKS